MSTILITHDLGLAATYCDRVVVMEKGHVVETALSRTIFTAPSHAYTRKLMRATPRPGASLRELLPEDEGAATHSVGSLQPQTRSAPSPLVGEGWGGGSCGVAPTMPHSTTPTPNPSPQGGGGHTESGARSHTESVAKSGTPLLTVEKLVKEYPRKGGAGGLGKLF